MPANFHIISSQLNAGQLRIHVHAAALPGHGFEPVKPTLEDAYFTQLFSTADHV